MINIKVYAILAMLGGITILINKYRIKKIFKNLFNDRNKANKVFNRNLKIIEEGMKKNNLVKKYESDAIFEYSIEKSVEKKFRTIEGTFYFKKPDKIKRKGLSNVEELQMRREKIMNKKYAKELSKVMSLKEFNEIECFRDRSLHVFIESIFGTKVVARDNTSIKEIDLNKFYDIAGDFVIINLDRHYDKINVNYILNNN